MSPRDGTLRTTTSSDDASGPALAADGPTAAFLSSNGTLSLLTIPFHVAAQDASSTEVSVRTRDRLLQSFSQTHDEALLKECKIEQLIDADDDDDDNEAAVSERARVLADYWRSTDDRSSFLAIANSRSTSTPP